jgi:hypothetical protein
MSRAELERAVASYVTEYRRQAARELEYVRRLRSDEDAVSEAALARLPSGKRHPHQYRIPLKALEESRHRLVRNIQLLKGAGSFDALFELVREIIGPIRGIGELAVYDTAVRIGARFGLEPERVYLHCGTREGAKMLLSVDTESDVIERDELPPQLDELSASEVEDFLCIYRHRFDASALGCRPRLAPAQRRC